MARIVQQDSIALQLHEEYDFLQYDIFIFVNAEPGSKIFTNFHKKRILVGVERINLLCDNSYAFDEHVSAQSAEYVNKTVAFPLYPECWRQLQKGEQMFCKFAEDSGFVAWEYSPSYRNCKRVSYSYF